MKGREAVRAANRRTNEAKAEAEDLRAQLAEERRMHKEESAELRSQIKQLTADAMARASRLAAEEVSRRLAQIEEERRARGLSDDIVKNNLYLKDKFVLNACKYVSMTTGNGPLDALAMVMTWMTGEDFYGFRNPEIIVKLGLPTDGWVARNLRHSRHDLKRVTEKRIRDGAAWGISLDRAEREQHSRIHPDYNPRWYPEVNYRGIELVES